MSKRKHSSTKRVDGNINTTSASNNQHYEPVHVKSPYFRDDELNCHHLPPRPKPKHYEDDID